MDDDPILNDKVFTFLIGPRERPYSVHIDVIGNLSKPLKAMMTSGMQESIDMRCALKDVDPETFGFFLQYAYRGVYRAEKPSLIPDSTTRSKSEQIDLSNKHCGGCGSCFAWNHSTCKPGTCYRFARGGSYDRYCSGCGQPRETLNPANGSIRYAKCTNTLCGIVMAMKEPHGLFEFRQYAAEGLSHDDYRVWLDSHRPVDAVTDKPITHVKLYLFSAYYMIDSLQQQCLHKLHRDLVELDLDGNVGNVVEMLKYTYEQTSSSDEDSQEVVKALRDLVIAYIIWKEKELVKIEEFINLVRGGGEIVEDLFRQHLA